MAGVSRFFPQVNLRRSDGGEYTCTASNGVGFRANDKILLIVHRKKDI